MNGTVAFVLANKNITSALSGVKDIGLEEPRTIKFTTNDDNEFRIEIPVPDLVWVGDSAPTDPMYELWVDTSDLGTTSINKAILSEDITSGITIGSVTTGTQFKVGDSLEDVIRQMLTIKSKPKVTIGINPTTVIYDATTEKLEKLMISGNVTPGSSAVSAVKFYVDGKLVKTIEDDVANGGVIKYEHIFAEPQKKTFVVKVEAVDMEAQIGSSQTTINFIAPSYYGFLPEDTTFDADKIKTLQNKELKIKKELTYASITTPGTDSYYITYCYPTELGSISSVKDGMNFEYIQDYKIENIKIDDIDYILMYQTEPGSVEDYIQKFV